MEHLTKTPGLILQTPLSSRFGSVVAHPDLDEDRTSQVPVWVIAKTIKMVIIAPQSQPVLVIMSKRNALAIKSRSSYLIQQTFRQKWFNSRSWLSNKNKGYKTYGP